MVINNVSEGSCATQGWGGTASYKKKMKFLYIRTTKCPNRQKNLDYWYFLNKYRPKPQKFNVFLDSMDEKCNKNAKVEQLTKVILRIDEEKWSFAQFIYVIPSLMHHCVTSVAVGWGHVDVWQTVAAAVPITMRSVHKSTYLKTTCSSSEDFLQL